MAKVIVEQSFESPIDEAEYDRMARRLDPCLEIQGARWQRSYFALDRTRVVCEFEASDAETVRMSYRSAGLAFVRVWTAEVFASE